METEHENCDRKRIRELAWKRFGFTPVVVGKKTMAKCIHCNNCQANTSRERMMKHRNACSKYKGNISAEDSSKVASQKPTENKGTSTSEDEGNADDEILPTDVLDSILHEEEIEHVHGNGIMEDDTFDHLVDADMNGDSFSEATKFVLNELKSEHIIAETEYLEAKAIYFEKLNTIAQLKRSLTILEAKKTHLEIQKLKA